MTRPTAARRLRTEVMTENYRGFHLCGYAEPQSDTLMGQINQWMPSGSIDYIRRNNSVVELTRFRFTAMTFDNEVVARWFGLEIARILLNSSYREFAIARYETEKRFIKHRQLSR
jgi:hypothetical protein